MTDGPDGKDAVASGTQNVEAATQTRHRGWDRGDYRQDDLGAFSGVTPHEGLDASTELGMVLDRIEVLGEVDVEDRGAEWQCEKRQLMNRAMKLRDEIGDSTA